MNNNKLPRFRFMAMSKLIGVITFIVLFIVVTYSMYEMHISQNYESLSQLIISAFGFAGIYTGFYITMAKHEHIEEEKTKREKELKNLEQTNAQEDDIIAKRQEIAMLCQKMNDIIGETNSNTL